MGVVKHTYFDIIYNIDSVEIRFKNDFDLPPKKEIIDYFKPNSYYTTLELSSSFLVFILKTDVQRQIILNKIDEKKYCFTRSYQASYILGNFINEHFLPFLFKVPQNKSMKGLERQLSLFDLK